MHLTDVRLDPGDELDRGCTCPDHGDALVRQVVSVVPRRRVEQRALEALDAGDVGKPGLAQSADRRHEDVGGHLAAGRLDPPPPVRRLPARLQGLVAEADVRADAEAVGALHQVVLDLGLVGERPGPLRVRRERERVEAGGDVALAARVGVVAPRAADLVRALEEDEVLDARLAQADAQPEPGEAAADDRDAGVFRQFLHY